MRVDRERIRNFVQARQSGLWYSISNVGYDTTEVFVFDEISFYGVTADQFVRDLQSIDTPKLNVRINSPGGDVFDGIAIFNALRQHSAFVTTQVDSLAASIASVIAQAGDRRVVMPHGQLMIHEAAGVAVGNADEMLAFAELLDKQSGLIASIYADRSGGDADHFRALMKAETWLSDQEALDLGLVDEIAELPSKNPTNSIKDNSGPSDRQQWLDLIAAAEAHSLEDIV